MKKLVSLLLTLVIMISAVGLTAYADNGGTKVKLNGEMKTLVAYNIKDNNYFKLRDIANLLKGTQAEFDVIWNSEKGAIELLSKTAYSTNEALTSETLKNPVATSSYVPIYKDGAQILLGAYNIADNNYFKLRDVASAINFYVGWNATEGIIEIDTSKEYEYPTSTAFGLNTKYLSLIGKTKGEIDKMLGNSTYWADLSTSCYQDNISYDGIMVEWNYFGMEVPESAVATGLTLPFNELFFNCPENLTAEQIKAQFNSSYEGLDIDTALRTLYTNYCGKTIKFNIQHILTQSSNASLRIGWDFENPNVESIQIINSVEEQTPPESYATYYEYAVAHDNEFSEINKQHGYSGSLYYLADVDHDGQKEMISRIGYGVGVYKIINGKVEEIFCDKLEESTGNVRYWYGVYEDKDYLIYTSNASDEYQVLYTIKDGELNAVITSMIENGNYKMNDKNVGETEYYDFINNIEHPVDISINRLK